MSNINMNYHADLNRIAEALELIAKELNAANGLADVANRINTRRGGIF